MRGERCDNHTSSNHRNGSSPHARGTLPHQFSIVHRGRFIPACAGNARLDHIPVMPSAVHPRMRGERVRRSEFHQLDTGSSPHARGTPTAYDPRNRAWRFIPACAGNAAAGPPHPVPQSVHPRMRGERPCRIIPIDTPGRFIPACAGNAEYDGGKPDPATVHPRMRGERSSRVVRFGLSLGSSPHARGTPESPEVTRLAARFIPACAGNADLALPQHDRSAVHPRMRGERRQRMIPETGPGGSSPHARGTLDGRHRKTARKRFIPACAGNALPISY